MKKKIFIIAAILVVVLMSMVSCSAVAKLMSRTNTVNYQINIDDLEKANVAEVVASNSVNACARVIATFRSGMVEETVSGAGFVVTADGYLITNRHVVVLYANHSGTKTSMEKTTECYIPMEPNEIKVAFADDKVHKATLEDYSSDDDLDLAIIKIKNEADVAYQYLQIDQTSELYYGQSVYTFGNPEGIGILFCTGNVASPSLRMSATSSYESILIDGNINHGNSGGALLDSNSRVIGVVYARVEGKSSSSVTYGLGCAIKASDLINYIKSSSVASKVNYSEYKPEEQ